MRWVTFFPKFERVHLTKDVGLIPYYVGLAGHDSMLLGRSNHDLENPEEVSGLKIEKLPDLGSKYFLDRAFLNWLEINAKQIDVLHLFHLARDTILYGRYFKKWNPRGKLYLKMDAYNDHLIERKQYSKNPLKNFYLNQVQKGFFKSLHYASVENRQGVELVSATYPELKEKMGYLPNGVNDQFLKDSFDQKHVEGKIILSVGRLGSSDKNYELFLTALPKLSKLDCRFVLVGPISDEFQKRIDSVFKLHPEAKEKIIFTGSISDRTKLYELYAKSSVFFLPSRFESFGIAFTEALYFGACLVGHSGMYAYDDISSKGKYGILYEDNHSDSLVKAIELALIKSDEDGFREEAKAHARNNFVWSKLTKELLTKLGYA